MINSIITNKTEHNIFLDIDGKGDVDKIIQIGPKARVKVSFPNERRFIEVSKKFRKHLILKKII